MSKLGDKIRRATRTEAPPIGFAAAAARRAVPTMVVVVSLDPKSAGQAATMAEKGADAVVITAGDAGAGIQAIKAAAEAAGGLPCGLWTAAADRDLVRRARESGADFVVFSDEESEAAVLQETGIGLLMAVRDDISDTLLRTIDALPVEALALREPDGSLTVRRQMELQRIAGFSRRPLLMTVNSALDADRLVILRDAGVAGVVMDGTAKGAADRVAEVKGMIEGLPPRRRRREERPEPVLPRGTEAAGEEEEEDEDRLS